MELKTTKKIPTRREMNEVIATLKANGWEHTATVMADDASPENHEFGLRFAKGTERFWLNLYTINGLPK